MDSIRGPIIFAFFTFMSAVSVATAQSQLGSAGGYVPSHERMAASVFRNRAIRSARGAFQPANQPAAAADITVLDESSPLSDLAPPTPPMSWTKDSTNTTSTSITGSGLKATTPDEYPITPELISTPAPEMLLEDPYGAPVGEVYGCDGGPACGGCAHCAGDYCWIDSFSLNLGVAGFKNAINNGLSGSFGFQQGFNWGSPWAFRPFGMNTQLGLRTIQSEFGGTRFDGGNLNDDHRFQFFVTGGFFKRVSCGWQGGVVFDYLRDEWVGEVDLGQIRGELSWAVPSGGSFGVWFATSVTDDTGRGLSTSSNPAEFDTHDIYAAFYQVRSAKHRLEYWRVFAGFTGESDGIIGSDFKIPLAGTWSMEPEFTYLVPDESTSTGAPAEEGWNVAFNVVWYPGRAVRGIDYARLPLFDVAGNGSMISRRVR